MKWIIALVFVITSGCASQKTTPDTSPETPVVVPTGSLIKCALDKDQRILELQTAPPDSCSLLYTKFGSQKSVAESSSGSTYCEKVKNNITDRLIRSGFKCE